MANANQLVAWAIQNFETLNVRIERAEWIKEFFPEFSDVTVHINVLNREISGWGAGPSENLALAKALAEALERTLLEEKRFTTSNGLAAHLDFESASKSATSELIERDLFLCHFLTKTPFKRMERPVASSVLSFSEWLDEHGVRLELFHLGEEGVLCTINGKHAGFGYSIGTAIKDSLEESVFSACIEAGRRVTRILHKQDHLKTLSLDEFIALPSHFFPHHGQLALDLNYAHQIEYLFEGEGVIGPSVAPECVTSTQLYLQDSAFEGCPLSFAQATSPSVQDLFLGPTNKCHINFERLSEFSGRTIDWGDLNSLPHPFD